MQGREDWGTAFLFYLLGNNMDKWVVSLISRFPWKIIVNSQTYILSTFKNACFGQWLAGLVSGVRDS